MYEMIEMLAMSFTIGSYWRSGTGTHASRYHQLIS